MDWINIEAPVEYSSFLKTMEHKLNEIILNKSDETIYLLQHENVYTAGTNFKAEELLDDTKIPVILTGRGGKYTYHGLGQAIVYPLIDLRQERRSKDIKLYVRNLEEVIINTLKHYKIKAYTIKDMVGIWVNNQDQPAKIGAIGIRIKKWVTYHGIAVNISTDLKNYKGIIPCGISNFPVTSIQELGVETTVQEFNYYLKKEFEKIF